MGQQDPYPLLALIKDKAIRDSLILLWGRVANAGSVGPQGPPGVPGPPGPPGTGDGYPPALGHARI